MSKELETKITIAGELNASVQKSISAAGKKLETLSKNVDDSYKSLAKLNKEMLGKAGHAFKSLEKAAIVAGAALTTAFAGAAIATGKVLLDMSAEYRNATNTIKNSTGATGEELKKLSITAREIWKSGLGENMQEVAAALSNVEQTSGLAGEELKKATKYGMMLKNAFEFEIAESSRASSALMKNFGITAEEAYGIIAAGAQNGANKNGDMLDTLNEYSVHYKALGFTAEQFVTSLIKGAEAGSWSVDKVGDAVKEFTIRAKDGSKKSLEAFQALGLNGAKMTKAFAAGGEQASAAFNQTIKALQAMKDPVKQNAAGVALFGTMFEDLEAGMLDTMASMKTANIDAAKTIKGIEETASGGITATITRIWRTMKDTLYPVTETINNALKEYAPVLEDLAARALPIVQGAVQELNGYIQEAMAKLKNWLVNLDFEAIKAKITECVNTCKEWGKWIIENRDTLLAVAKNIALVYAGIKTVQIGIAIWKKTAAAITAVKTAYKFLTAEQTKQKIAQISGTVASSAATAATWAQTAATWALNTAIAVLTSPITLVIAGIAALIAIVAVLYKNWDKITAWMSEKWQQFSEAFPQTAAWLENKWAAICEAVKIAWDAVCYALSAAWEGIKAAWAAAAPYLEAIWAGVCTGFKAYWETVCSFFKTAWEIVSAFFTMQWENLKAIFSGVASFITSLWNAACAALKGDWAAFGQHFAAAGGAIQTAFCTVWNNIKNYVQSVIKSILSFIQPIIDKVAAIGNALGSIKDKAAGAIEGIKNSKINPANWFAAGGFTSGPSICGEAGTEAVISFDPAYRAENIGYWRTAGEMLGAFDAGGGTRVETARTSNSTTINLGGIKFAPVIKTGNNVDSGSLLQQLRACMPDVVDMITAAIREEEAHRYA